VTFYKDVQQLPSFEDYSMKGRTYRYFTGEPLWPFGYGLSYTNFRYDTLTVPKGAIHAGEPLSVTVNVTNIGSVDGDEVAQLYLQFPDISGAPLRALRGFQRIHLAAGATRRVAFHLQQRDLSMVTEAGDIIVARGHYTVAVGGGQPGAGAPAVSAGFDVEGQIRLPE
jgi:beta-glucosidase